MKDFLEEMCGNLGIRLIFVNNKIVLLSCDIKDNVPIIRAHKIFKEVSEEVAVSIIGYYTDHIREKEHENIIRSYIKEKFPEEVYKIKRPIEVFKSLMVDIMPYKSYLEDDNDSLVELIIDSMIMIESSGLEKYIDPVDPLIPFDDDILEIDITVDPIIT